MGKIIFLLCSIFILLLAACQTTPDHDAIKAEILNLHRGFIKAHLDKDASFIAKPTSPEYIFVSNGEIENISPSELEQNLSGYLNSTEFSEYRDINEPIIGVSQDGLLAWAVVKVRTAGIRKRSDGSQNQFDIQWAWITLYEKKDEQWIRLVDVSTDRPYEDKSE